MPSIIPIPALADNCVRLLVQAAVAALGDLRATDRFVRRRARMKEPLLIGLTQVPPQPTIA
jgi:hypothetical protein